MSRLISRAVEIYKEEGLKTLLRRSYWFFIPKILGKNRSFRWHSHYRKFRANHNEALSDPYKIIRINPSRIEHRVRAIPKTLGFGQVHGGDWDRKYIEPIEKHPTHIALYQRFVEGYEWEYTEYVDYAKESFRKGEDKWGYESLEEFKEMRCQYVDRLYESMKKDGYVPNHQNDADWPEKDHRLELKPHNFEPIVCIGRDGEILYKDGIHRVAIAKILDIDKIPVNILARHKKWQELREEIANADSKDELSDRALKHLNHPDMEDINMNLQL